MTLRVETITPDQQDDLIAALRPYEHELQPEWIEPPGYFERKVEAMFDDTDRWLWWGVNLSGERVGFVIFRKFRDWPDDSKWVGSILAFWKFIGFEPVFIVTELTL